MTSREVSSPVSAVPPNFDRKRDDMDQFPTLVIRAWEDAIGRLEKGTGFYIPKLPPMVGVPEKEEQQKE